MKQSRIKTLNGLSNKVCLPNNTEDLNVHFLKYDNRNKRIKNISNVLCKCRFKFHGRKSNLNQKWDNNNCQCEFKIPKEHQCEKCYFWNPAKFSCKNGKYTGSFGNSVVICDKIIEEGKCLSIEISPTKSTSRKTVPTKCTLTNF